MTLPPSTIAARRLTASILWQLVAMCLVIVGCKLWLIGSFSSPLPFLDQWKGEGAQVLRPWMQGHLHLTDLIAPFNEHRIVPSRLLVLAIFEANARQWDAQVQMIAGTLLHAACAFVLGAVLVARLGASRKWPIFAALLVLFCLPFDWQNTLWGFQSQFYFLILFSVVAFWGLGGHAAGRARWWGGLGAAFLACLSMGSGGFAGLALAGWLGVKFLVDPGTRCQRGNWVTLGLSLALGALGFALYTPPTAASLTAMHVQSAGAFLHGLGIHLSWPHSASPFLALIAFAPLAILAWIHLRELRGRPGVERSVEDFLFPLGLWVILQAAALAWSRNHAMASVISRYMDLLALGALVNFCALLRLVEFAVRRPYVRWAAVAWCGLAIAGLIPLLQRNIRLDLPSLNQIHRVQAAAVRQFLTTDRVADLGGKPVFGLPPADLDLLAELLRDPVIQNILPTGIGVRRVPAPPGPLTTAGRELTDGWGLPLGAGLLIFILTALNERLLRRRQTADAQPPALAPEICRIPS